MRQQFRKAIADTISLTMYQNNRPIVPSSATITIYKPDGSTLQASDTATVDGTTGKMTYSLTASHTATADLNYKAVWAYVVSGTTYYQDQLFDVVLSVLSIPVVDDDLYDELNSLRKEQIQDTGTATAGAASTITDTTRRSEVDDYWNGGTIDIIGGTGIGQKRDVTDFVQSTSVITVTPAWTTQPDSTSTYRIVRSFTKQIRQSFEKLETMLINRGLRHALIIESSEIKFPLIYLTIHFIALDLMSDVDDKWDRIAQKYWDLFTTAFGTMRVSYDEDESGTITEDEKGYGAGSISIGRA